MLFFFFFFLSFELKFENSDYYICLIHSCFSYAEMGF
jgi:hypothetical protein